MFSELILARSEQSHNYKTRRLLESVPRADNPAKRGIFLEGLGKGAISTGMNRQIRARFQPLFNGFEQMDLFKTFLKNDRVAVHSNVELISMTPGVARAKMVIQPHHLNGLGTAMGCVLAHKLRGSSDWGNVTGTNGANQPKRQGESSKGEHLTFWKGQSGLAT
jgi:hypothetical protein